MEAGLGWVGRVRGGACDDNAVVWTTEQLTEVLGLEKRFVDVLFSTKYLLFRCMVRQECRRELRPSHTPVQTFAVLTITNAVQPTCHIATIIYRP